MANVEAHITGTVWKIECTVGQEIAEGDTLVILESMKMEMPVEAEDEGTVKEIKGEGGQSVSGGDTPVFLEYRHAREAGAPLGQAHPRRAGGPRRPAQDLEPRQARRARPRDPRHAGLDGPRARRALPDHHRRRPRLLGGLRPGRSRR